MKKTNKFISVLLVLVMLMATVSVAASASEPEGNTVILYTNDVHCAIEDYAVLAAYRAELIAQGNNVITVDAGDAIQGEVIGALTEGEAVVDIMNAVGYDYAVPGNHEFDYGMDVFLDLANNKAEYDYISSNFHDLTSVNHVLKPYAIKDFGDYQVAFVGITTPETVTKSTPEFFKGEGGNFIYGFPVYPDAMTNEILYDEVQKSVDSAAAEGADIVVAVGHTGILETSDGWKSTDIIANTDGIDYYIDAHSHETIENNVYKNANDEDVVLTSTGTKFANFGKLTISGDNAEFELINPDDVVIETMSPEAKAAYNAVKNKIDNYVEEISYLYEEIGTSEVKLVAYDTDKSWAVRKRETNAGDFVADAYRAVTGADVAIANGGGVRADVGIGSVTRKALMDVNAFNNDMCVLEVTGQQLVDVLEHGARECPDPIGGFFQVSGVSFEIHTYRESPVICDQLDNFIEMDETKERRVQNVCVNGEPVDLDKTYTLAGSAYVLTQGGDGLTMLDGAKVIQKDGLPCDSEMLIKYLELLGGKISADKYGDPDGDGRIKIFNAEPDAFHDYEIKCGETINVSVLGGDFDNVKYTYVKFIPEEDGRFVFESKADTDTDPFCNLFDSELEELDGNDDSFDLNFRIVYEFEKGKTYYFCISVYSDSGEFDVTLNCAHSYADGVCTVCGHNCDHEGSDTNPIGCGCGKVFNGEDISDGDKIEFDSPGLGNYSYFRFVPEKSGIYIFKSVSDSDESDPACELYNAFFESVDSSDDVNGFDFLLICELEEGEPYYFSVWNNYDDAVCELELERVVHAADDGSEHSLEYVEETYSNCTEHGYSAGIYCSDCEEFIWGHEEQPLEEDYHVDDNFDEICDLCGKENIYDMCGCICHNGNPFLMFIWRIANFLHSIFGIFPICECGDMHY